MVRTPSKQQEKKVLNLEIRQFSMFLITLNQENEREETTCDHC